MNKDLIISKIANDERFKSFALMLTKHRDIHKDLMQETLIILHQMPIEALAEIREPLLYANNIMYKLNLCRLNQRKNLNGQPNPLIELCQTHDEYNKQTKHKVNNYDYSVDIKFREAMKHLDTFNTSDVIVFLESLNKSLVDIHRQTGIPLISIKQKKKKIITKLKEKLK